jgi:hypothetical protein
MSTAPVLLERNSNILTTHLKCQSLRLNRQLASQTFSSCQYYVDQYTLLFSQASVKRLQPEVLQLRSAYDTERVTSAQLQRSAQELQDQLDTHMAEKDR